MTSDAASAPHPDAAGPFANLSQYLELPRVTGLRLSPDGAWLAATVQQRGADGKKFVTSLWRLPVDGGAGAARLTRSAQGEDNPAFLPDGSLLFSSQRPDPGAGGSASDSGDDGRSALWLLPAAGGEAVRIASPPGGVGAIAAARQAPDVVIVSDLLPGAASAEQDAQRRKQREDGGITAILHEDGQVRHWDHDLGPDEPHLLGARVEAGALAGPPRDLTPAPGRALDDQSLDLAPDGSVAVTGWTVRGRDGARVGQIVMIGAGTAVRHTLLADPDADFSDPRVSPDGRMVVAVRHGHDSYDQPGDATLVVAPLDGSDGPDDLLPELDRWPVEAMWAADSQAVYFTADDGGRRPVFRVGLASRQVVRITADDGAYESLCVSSDGRRLYALRSAVDSPPTPVRIDLDTAGFPLTSLPGPAPRPRLPGRLTEVAAPADDGARIRGWLVLPESASPQAPAPLLLWVHGGPRSSWNSWTWRWNPWLMAARGYAVLLPDPALSTGYGLDFIARGHGNWGPRPYADLMAITDAVLARPDIDAERTAVMGGSYGGYMANWIAGHTSRFRAVVSHAGLWALDQMFGTTDSPPHWRRQFGDPLASPERYQANSPHLSVGAIRTPMLVIHGDKDYRVPIGEALRLWSQLTAPEAGVPAKFLYFPTENHWILTPGHAAVWYETVLAFLAEHVLGEPWRRPALV